MEYALRSVSDNGSRDLQQRDVLSTSRASMDGSIRWSWTDVQRNKAAIR